MSVTKTRKHINLVGGSSVAATKKRMSKAGAKGGGGRHRGKQGSAKTRGRARSGR